MPESGDFQAGREEGRQEGQVQGQILSELKTLSMSFIEFKQGIGKRMGDAEVRLEEMHGKIDLLMWLLRGVATPIVSAIGISILGFLAWHFFTKS